MAHMTVMRARDDTAWLVTVVTCSVGIVTDACDVSLQCLSTDNPAFSDPATMYGIDTTGHMRVVVCSWN